MSPLSLRARLVLGVLALATVGLITADAVTYTSLRSFLIERVDAGLEADHFGAERMPGIEPGGLGPGGPGGGPDAVCGGTGSDFVQLRSATGEVFATCPVPAFEGTVAPPGPRLPARIGVPATPNDGPDRVSYFTVPALYGGGSYRVRASIEHGTTDMLILATSLASVTGTLHRLLLIELFVTLAVLAGIGALGLWIVRLGLRPLDAIGRTAKGITEGDLAERVERAEPRTEVGRLGLALNTMLDRIEASDARLRRFVADASHELRTPLAAVRAYAELFERGAAERPADLARAMGGIHRESERMSALVDDLLLLARLDEGLPLEREPVALDALATEAVETARTVDPSRRVDLRVEPLTVVGDRARLRQVFDNLLGNVRAHTPPGTAASVRVRRDGDTVLIEVVDEGPGVPADELPRLFERFYRTDVNRSRARGGTGLGLSIVAAIARAHRGTVSAGPAPGGGASFVVTLPLAAGEAAPLS